MKIEVQPHEDHQAKIIAEFETTLIEEYKRRAARKIGRETRIPGFRPGKAPLDMVRRVIGEEALQQQAVEDMIDELYPKILEEAKVTPSGSGSLEEIISLDPPKFAFIVPLEPEVNLGTYKDIRLDYHLDPVTEQEVDEFLKRMQTSYATAEPVERPAGEGDLVYVKLSGVLTNPAEGEDANVFPERPAQFIIGTDIIQNRDWPFPGFTDQLAGISADQEKTITYTFLEDEKDEALRGKEVKFTVVDQSVKALHLPDLDDNFAQTVGEFETIEALRKSVRTQLETSKKDETDDKYFVELLDKMVEGAEIKYPSHILDHEVEHLLEHLKEDLKQQGMEMDAYFKMLDTDREKYIEEKVKPAALKRLARSLVLEEIGKQENIQLGEDDYKEAVNSTLDQLKAMPAPQKRKERVSQDMINSAAASALSRKYNDRVLERIKQIATGEAEAIASQSAETLIHESAAPTNEPAAKASEPVKAKKAAPKRRLAKKE